MDKEYLNELILFAKTHSLMNKPVDIVIKLFDADLKDYLESIEADNINDS